MPNFSAAAAALGRRTDNPAQVRKWLRPLTRLFAAWKAADPQARSEWRACADERMRVWETPGARFLDPRVREAQRVRADARRQLQKQRDAEYNAALESRRLESMARRSAMLAFEQQLLADARARAERRAERRAQRELERVRRGPLAPWESSLAESADASDA